MHEPKGMLWSITSLYGHGVKGSLEDTTDTGNAGSRSSYISTNADDWHSVPVVKNVYHEKWTKIKSQSDSKRTLVTLSNQRADGPGDEGQVLPILCLFWNTPSEFWRYWGSSISLATSYVCPPVHGFNIKINVTERVFLFCSLSRHIRRKPRRIKFTRRHCAV
jgi:hypothetical protein